MSIPGFWEADQPQIQPCACIPPLLESGECRNTALAQVVFPEQKASVSAAASLQFASQLPSRQGQKAEECLISFIPTSLQRKKNAKSSAGVDEVENKKEKNRNSSNKMQLVPLCMAWLPCASVLARQGQVMLNLAFENIKRVFLSTHSEAFHLSALDSLPLLAPSTHCSPRTKSSSKGFLATNIGTSSSLHLLGCPEQNFPHLTSSQYLPVPFPASICLSQAAFPARCPGAAPSPDYLPNSTHACTDRINPRLPCLQLISAPND